MPGISFGMGLQLAQRRPVGGYRLVELLEAHIAQPRDTEVLRRESRNVRVADRRAAIQGVADAELAELYKASYFTVFPSFCEGWGLPVAESLFHGRYCIASNATSIRLLIFPLLL